MFYNNVEVEVIAELPNDESVIEFITGEYYDEESGYGEPIEQRIVVNNANLSAQPITKDEVLLEREAMLREMNEQKQQMLSTVNREIRKEKNDLHDEIKNMKKIKEEVQKENEYYKTALKLKNGDFKFVIYGAEILTFEEFAKKIAKNCDYEDEPDFKDLALKIKPMQLTYKSSRYWDDVYYPLCETIEEAINKFKETTSKYDELSIQQVKTIKEYNIQGFEEKVKAAIKKHNDGIYRTINTYEKNIESQKSRLCFY